MLALCLMLSGTYYAKNYAGIIGRGLPQEDKIFDINNLILALNHMYLRKYTCKHAHTRMYPL